MMPSTVSYTVPVVKGVVGTLGAKYLTCVFANEQYGVDTLRVQAMRGGSAVIEMPESLPALMCVMHLRGAIVPVGDLHVDLRIVGRQPRTSAVGMRSSDSIT
jgi:chemotaxis signal transduction protein